MTPRRPRDIGTAAETAVVRTARAVGFPWADRNALHGTHDIGDVTLCPGVIVEVKGGEMARNASGSTVEGWLVQTEAERVHARADVGLLVVQARGVSGARAHLWSAWWRLAWVHALSGSQAPPGAGHIRVRMTYGDALVLLQSAGYGTPLGEPWDTATPAGP